MSTWWQLHFLWRRDFGSVASISCATCRFDGDIRFSALVTAVLLAPVLAFLSDGRFKRPCCGFGLRAMLLGVVWYTANRLFLQDRLWGTFSDSDILYSQWPRGLVTVACLSVLLAALPLLWRRKRHNCVQAA